MIPSLLQFVPTSHSTSFARQTWLNLFINVNLYILLSHSNKRSCYHVIAPSDCYCIHDFQHLPHLPSPTSHRRRTALVKELDLRSQPDWNDDNCPHGGGMWHGDSSLPRLLFAFKYTHIWVRGAYLNMWRALLCGLIASGSLVRWLTDWGERLKYSIFMQHKIKQDKQSFSYLHCRAATPPLWLYLFIPNRSRTSEWVIARWSAVKCAKCFHPNL